jgi:ribosomal protein S18 acetylase RimI-like enzyme
VTATGLCAQTMANLGETYVALGRSVPGATLVQGEGFRACTGELRHGICNFAVVNQVTKSALGHIRELGTGRPVLNLYMSGEDAAAHDHLLEENGFARAFQLVQMVAHRAAEGGSLDIDECPHRVEVASFMIGQFFPGLAGQTRRAVVEATAAAAAEPPLQLVALRENGALIGAAMLSSAAGMLSLYNLCIATSHQGRGFGTALVQEIVGRATAQNLVLGLQCDVRLEAWYSRLGLASIGTVEVFVLPNASPGVIMN